MEEIWVPRRKTPTWGKLVTNFIAWAGFELTTLVVIDTDCIASYKSNYHTITNTMPPKVYSCKGKKKECHIIRHLSKSLDFVQSVIQNVGFSCFMWSLLMGVWWSSDYIRHCPFTRNSYNVRSVTIYNGRPLKQENIDASNSHIYNLSPLRKIPE